MQTADFSAEGSLVASRADRPSLLYDDGCRFCRAMAEALYHVARRRDLAFLPWSSGIAEVWLRDLEPVRAMPPSTTTTSPSPSSGR